MNQEQIQEWRANPVTKLFFNTIREAVRAQQEEPRYRPVMTIGDQKIPVTSDMTALQNALAEGRIDAFNEVLQIELEA